MQNVEFKAELRDFEVARSQCRALGAHFVRELDQKDTYFKLPDGRLKRREVPGEPIEWIFYHRSDRPTPKMSHFMLYSDEQAKTRWGVLPLREWMVVNKTRELWLVSNVRIHLDRVEELGDFIEFEAQVSRKNHVKACHEQIAALREAFAPILGEAIAAGYVNLLDQLKHEPADESERS